MTTHEATHPFKLGLIGLAAGFVSTLMGIGGGLVMVPALHLTSGFTIKRAVGTSLACIIPIALVGAASHYALLDAAFPWVAAMILTLGAVVGAQIGVWVFAKIDAKWVSIGFMVLLLITAARILLKADWVGDTTVPNHVNLALIGLAAGFSSSMLGIGGGVVIVGMMVGIFRTHMLWAVSLSLVVIVPTAISGLIGHARQRNIQWQAVLPIALPALFSAFLSAHLAHLLPLRVLEIVFCAFIGLTVFKMWQRIRSADATASKKREP